MIPDGYLDCLVCKKVLPAEQMFTVDTCSEVCHIRLENNYCPKNHVLSFDVGVGYWRAKCECGIFDVSLGEKGRFVLTHAPL